MKLADMQEWAKATLGLDIPRSTLGDILKDSEKWLRAGKENDTTLRERSGREASLEEALLTWFTDIRNRGVPVSDAMLIEKARFFGGKLGKHISFSSFFFLAITACCAAAAFCVSQALHNFNHKCFFLVRYRCT